MSGVDETRRPAFRTEKGMRCGNAMLVLSWVGTAE
jgi:hypothetical protein